MDELWEQARLELEDMLFATPLVKGPADSGAFYSPSNQICDTPLRDATLGSLCAPLGSPASPVTCPADEPISPFPPYSESSIKTVLTQSPKIEIFPVKETRLLIKEADIGVGG
jgi:hypothetical protein